MLRIPGLRWASVASPILGLLGALILAASFLRAGLMVRFSTTPDTARPGPGTSTFDNFAPTPANVAQVGLSLAIGVGMVAAAERIRRRRERERLPGG
jgi:hypothetical protein